MDYRCLKVSAVQSEEKEGTMRKGVISTYFAADTLEVSFSPLQRESVQLITQHRLQHDVVRCCGGFASTAARRSRVDMGLGDGGNVMWLGWWNQHFL